MWHGTLPSSHLGPAARAFVPAARAYGGGVKPSFPPPRGAALAALTLCALLAACQKQPAAEDLAARVLFTANGSYDASADARTREGHGVRRVRWDKRPPLPARSVQVDYDSDLRPLAWVMTVSGAQFSAADLAAGQGRAVQTAQGPGTVIRGGRLKDVLVLPDGEGLRLLTRGYVTQLQPALLPAFAP